MHNEEEGLQAVRVYSAVITVKTECSGNVCLHTWETRKDKYRKCVYLMQLSRNLCAVYTLVVWTLIQKDFAKERDSERGEWHVKK